ncbi:hypothetical protein KSC_032830 [Ktedonobacter sp. SOSP1-52]|uniref:hypothetical protein n=1 Tax=Ktedonobacter sp. SOSP1-52 TaxID=2778366 RepID=UPI00191585FC|nr:hypothetical protein [Ktedonobacter sp. SOSP1-52]GHO64391.1 hypothetical protein KSC_032830 [Ktedonobacter sp. SOSP1-52]
MSTPACIAFDEGTSIHFIYLSQDGYPAFAGQILLQHFQMLEQVERLLAGGNLSRLGPELGEPHNFFEAQNNEELRQKTCDLSLILSKSLNHILSSVRPQKPVAGITKTCNCSAFEGYPIQWSRF